MGSKAWEVLDFVLLRLFNIAIVAPKVALKHRSKSWVADPATHRPSPPPPHSKKEKKKQKNSIIETHSYQRKHNCPEVNPLLNPFSTFICSG